MAKSDVEIINGWLCQRMALSLCNDQGMYEALRKVARRVVRCCDEGEDVEQLWLMAGEEINDAIREWIDEELTGFDALRIMIHDTLGLDETLGVMLAQELFDGIDDLRGE